MLRLGLTEAPDEERLVLAVECHRCIYDNGHANYYQRHEKLREWCDVARAVGVPVSDAQAKWKCLRDKYRKMKSRVDSTNIPPMWHLYDKMKFLDPFLRNMPSSSNNNDETSSLDESEDFIVCSFGSQQPALDEQQTAKILEIAEQVDDSPGSSESNIPSNCQILLQKSVLSPSTPPNTVQIICTNENDALTKSSSPINSLSLMTNAVSTSADQLKSHYMIGSNLDLPQNKQFGVNQISTAINPSANYKMSRDLLPKNNYPMLLTTGITVKKTQIKRNRECLEACEGVETEERPAKKPGSVVTRSSESDAEDYFFKYFAKHVKNLPGEVRFSFLVDIMKLLQDKMREHNVPFD